MNLAMVEFMLGSVAHHFDAHSRASLHCLGMQLEIRLQRLIALIRSQLFSCTPTEAALIDATDNIAALASHTQELMPSRGSLRASNVATREAAAASGSSSNAAPSSSSDPSAAGAAPPPKPSPRSLLELWTEVARTFRRACELQALMSALGVPIVDEQHQRLRRSQLEAAFAPALSRRIDPTAQAVALSIYPRLASTLSEEIDAAVAAAEAPCEDEVGGAEG